MEELVFNVKGSSTTPYKVTFVRKSENYLSAFCTCPAGTFGSYCKHRFNILDGIEKGIVSNNSNDVATVQSWIKGTELELSLEEMRKLDIEFAKIKKALAAAKKDVAKAMRS
mgnify:CR=1 FL=1